MATEEQKKVIDSIGGVSISAAPGSGKTWTAARLFVNRVRGVSHKRRGVALLSYTNVAVNEFKKQIQQLDSSIDVDSVHYIGTIDSFFERFVLSCFFYLIPGLTSRPMCGRIGASARLKIPACYIDGKRPGALDDVRCDYEKGRIIFKFKQSEHDVTGITLPDQIVRDLFMRAVVSCHRYTHEMRWLLVAEILKNREVCRLFANRFSEIIIDEAQDTRGIAFLLFEYMRKASALPINLSLIGDINQSIYSFAGASPEVYKRVVEHWQLKMYRISVNRRCSARVVEDIKYFFGGDMKALEGSGGGGVYYIESSAYEKLDFRTISCNFMASPQNVVVLSRHGVGGQVTPYLKQLFDVCIERDCHQNLKAACEKLLHFIKVYGDVREDESLSKGLLRLAWSVCKDKKNLPPLHTSWNEWRAVVKNTLQYVADCIEIEDLGCSKLKRPQKMPDNSLISDYLQCYSEVKTVHSVKGESYDGVIFIDEKYRWGKLFQYNPGEDFIADEDLRIMYVAMTRARKFVLLVLPDKVILKYRDMIEKKVRRLNSDELALRESSIRSIGSIAE